MNAFASTSALPSPQQPRPASTPERKPPPPGFFSMEFDAFSCQVLDRYEEPKEIYAVRREGSSVYGFVEAEEGEEFIVRVRCRRTNGNRYYTSLLLGGIKAHGQSHAAREARWTYLHRDRAISADEREAFRIVKANITDDDQAEAIHDLYTAASLTNITLVVEKVLKVVRGERTRFEKTDLSPRKPVHETVQKVGMINFAGGTVTKQENSRQGERPILDPSAKPINFVFHAVTRVGLELRHLVAPPKQPKWRTPKAEAASPSSSPAAGAPPRAGPTTTMMASPTTTSSSPIKRQRMDELRMKDLELQEQEQELELQVLQLAKRRRKPPSLGTMKEEEGENQGGVGVAAAAAAAEGGVAAEPKQEPGIFDLSGAGTAEDPFTLDD
ncbi:hypothetical protein V8E36_009915 [Tilletia maclaganii]